MPPTETPIAKTCHTLELLGETVTPTAIAIQSAENPFTNVSDSLIINIGSADIIEIPLSLLSLNGGRHIWWQILFTLTA